MAALTLEAALNLTQYTHYLWSSCGNLSRESTNFFLSILSFFDYNPLLTIKTMLCLLLFLVHMLLYYANSWEQSPLLYQFDPWVQTYCFFLNQLLKKLSFIIFLCYHDKESASFTKIVSLLSCYLDDMCSYQLLLSRLEQT